MPEVGKHTEHFGGVWEVGVKPMALDFKRGAEYLRLRRRVKLYQREEVPPFGNAARKFVARRVNTYRQEVTFYYYGRPPCPVQPLERALGVGPV